MVASSVYFPQNKLLIGSLNANASLKYRQDFTICRDSHCSWLSISPTGIYEVLLMPPGINTLLSSFISGDDSLIQNV